MFLYFKELMRESWLAFNHLVNSLTPMGRFIMAMTIALSLSCIIMFLVTQSLC